MKLQPARELFTAGELKEAKVVPAPMSDAWMIQIGVNRGTWTIEMLESKAGNMREFRTVEAAIAVLSDIGFKQSTIVFD